MRIEYIIYLLLDQMVLLDYVTFFSFKIYFKKS